MPRPPVASARWRVDATAVPDAPTPIGGGRASPQEPSPGWSAPACAPSAWGAGRTTAPPTRGASTQKGWGGRRVANFNLDEAPPFQYVRPSRHQPRAMVMRREAFTQPYRAASLRVFTSRAFISIGAQPSPAVRITCVAVQLLGESEEGVLAWDTVQRAARHPAQPIRRPRLAG